MKSSLKEILLFSILFISVWEVFAQENRELKRTESGNSIYQYNKELDYYFCLPRGYNSNEAKQFPLVIYLHGGGGYGKLDGFDYLGYSSDCEGEAKDLGGFQSNYPSFILIPQSKGAWDADKVIPIVEKFKSEYLVDEKRIYLIGYSMGGSGSYSFANGYYDYNKTLLAAIIRLAGQSQTALRDSIALNTSVWIHVGLDDTALRISIAREAYEFLKGNYPDGKESIEDIDIDGITGNTFTLEVKGIPKVKKTEYDGVGHGIYRFPFDDKGLLSWLFDQHLD